MNRQSSTPPASADIALHIMSLLTLPNELLLEIVKDFDAKTTYALLQTDHRLAALLAPRLLKFVTCKKRYGVTALYLAAVNGCEDKIREILDQGIHVADEKTLVPTCKNGRAMAWCTEKACLSCRVVWIDGIEKDSGRDQTVKLLLEKGASAVIQDFSVGFTSLHWAVYCENATVVRLLVDRGVDINGLNRSRETPLRLAVTEDLGGMVQLLVELGAGIDARDTDGTTVLHYAAKYRVRMAELLLELGAGIDIQDDRGLPALHHAIDWGNETAARLLLERGANVDIQCGQGRTALHRSAGTAELTAMKLLLERGANIDLQNSEGRTVLHFMDRSRSELDEALLNMLVERAHNLDIQDIFGSTALMKATAAGDETVVEKLLKNGADPNIHRGDGIAALLIAVQGRKKELVQLLLDHGADSNARGLKGRTALFCAVSYGSILVIEVLLVGKADINIRDSNGQTPLHYLMYENGRMKHREDGLATLTFLLNNGAGIDLQDNDGQTPLHLAIRHRSESYIKCLLNHGADYTIESGAGNLPEDLTVGDESLIWSLEMARSGRL